LRASTRLPTRLTDQNSPLHPAVKVEIGGDTQSTEGTEASHMHTRDDLNCSRGYEWDVLREARKRNGAIKTYGLSWGVPGWIGGGNYYSDDNLEYHLNWLYCANVVQQVPIDFMGKCKLHA